uniref:Uncharacterized protein n=1 Tax=Helianthus annuus TaxID=4232 RepID=A0A251VKG6_HELAN
MKKLTIEINRGNNDRQKDDSSKAVDADAEKIKREEVDEEAYQDKSALQVEEDDEEEDLNRIKEESRRRYSSHS